MAKALTSESTSGATLVVVGSGTVDLRPSIMIPLKGIPQLCACHRVAIHATKRLSAINCTASVKVGQIDLEE